MKLLNIKLKNYTRFYVTGIKYINYSPDKAIQIILATNASGKSSLLKEIIPNVEDLNKEYDTDGYRVATYEHNNKIYKLTYDRNSNKHSFIIDNVEYNKTGLKKIQKSLIEEHFNLTKPIHDMLLSTTTFTNMSINERKKWFTEILSKTDYTYAFNLYAKVKTNIRDLTSYIKLTQSKILKDEEFFKVMSDDDIKILKNDRDMFNKIIEDKLMLKKNLVSIDKPDFNLIKHLNSELSILINKLENINIDKKTNDKQLIILKTKLEHKNEILNNINNELNKLSKFNIDDSYNTVDIKKELDNIDKYFNNDFNLNKNDYIHLIENFNNNYINILELLQEYIEYNDINIKDIDINELNTTIINIKQNIEKYNRDIRVLEREVDELNVYGKQDDVICPKCNFSFKPNYNEIDLKNKTKLLETFYKEFNILKDTLNKKEILLNRYNKKMDILKRLYILLDNIKEFKPIIIKYLDDTDSLVNNFSNLYISLPKVDRLKSLNDEYNNLKDKLNLITSLSNNKLNEIKSKKEELLTKKVNIITEINELNDKIVKHKKISNIINNINDIRNKLDINLKNITKYKKYTIDILYNEYLNNIIKLAKEEIFKIDEKIARYENVKEHYKNLKIELDNYKKELIYNKKIEEYLSPNKGLIGLTISKTINIVLEKMNHIINKIWSYDVKILPCDVEDGDLNFKFPVLLNNSKTISDVSKGSSSIKEVIDLAFKITAMELLDMLDFPLILDEYSSTMDNVNRTNSFNYIGELSKEYFSQIFLISHYVEIFERFKNTDVNVLNNDNVNYTGVHNTVMEIK